MGARRVGDGVLAAVQQDLDEASRLAVGAGRVRPGAHRLGSEASVHGGFAYLTGLTGGLLEGAPLPRVNVYVDGLNLYNGALRDTPYRWLDRRKLSRG